MSNDKESLARNLETLLEIGRQKAAVVREFDRASLAQISHVRGLLDKQPELIDHYKDLLIRGERITQAGQYLASLNIPGYTPDTLEGISVEERDHAAVFMSLFAPDDPEFVVWRDVSEFNLEHALGRLGLGESALQVSPGTASTLEGEATDSVAVDPIALVEPPVAGILDDVPPVVEATKSAVVQVLYDDVVLHLSNEARDVLLTFKAANERLTVGRLRKLLGEGHEDDDSAQLGRYIKQVNAEFAKNYDGELIENTGGGWYAVSTVNLKSLTTQEVLLSVEHPEDVMPIEIAHVPTITATYKGKSVDLDHSLHYAILRVLCTSGIPLSAEALYANPSISAFESIVGGETKLKDMMRKGLVEIQEHFASEYGVEIATVYDGGKLPNEFTRQEGVLLIQGMRRGRKYTISPLHASDLKTLLLTRVGEVSTDNRSEEEIEAERLTNMKRLTVKIFQALHTTSSPLSMEGIVALMLEQNISNEASKNEVDAFAQLVFTAFIYLKEQTELFSSRGLRLKVTPPIEGDPMKYQIVEIEDESPEAKQQKAADSLAERRRKGLIDQHPEAKSARTMDNRNKLYATHAIIDGSRVEFTPHEAAVLAVLNIQPGKAPIDASKITGILRGNDTDVTRGDVDHALSGLRNKLTNGWVESDKPKGKTETWRMGKNAAIKTHTR